jgi:hypothetical protein
MRHLCEAPGGLKCCGVPWAAAEAVPISSTHSAAANIDKRCMTVRDRLLVMNKAVEKDANNVRGAQEL